MADWTERARAIEEPGTTTSAGVWKPVTEGEVLAGRIAEIREHTGDHDSTIVEIETEDGESIGVWLSTVLKDEFTKQNITPGDVVGLKYFGLRTSKNGRQFKSFGVQVLERKFEDDLPF